MLKESDITKPANKEYLDKVAVQVMTTYLNRSPLKGFEDSMSVSRIAYKQALAMLEVRENSIITLATEAGLIKKNNRDD
jgi:hypothetical protein